MSLNMSHLTTYWSVQGTASEARKEVFLNQTHGHLPRWQRKYEDTFLFVKITFLSLSLPQSPLISIWSHRPSDSKFISRLWSFKGSKSNLLLISSKGFVDLLEVSSSLPLSLPPFLHFPPFFQLEFYPIRYIAWKEPGRTCRWEIIQL